MEHNDIISGPNIRCHWHLTRLCVHHVTSSSRKLIGLIWESLKMHIIHPKCCENWSIKVKNAVRHTDSIEPT